MNQKISCIVAGVEFGQFYYSLPNDNRFLGYFPLKSYKVPYSELAIHRNAAGRDILAVACRISNDKKLEYCNVVYEDARGWCGNIEDYPSKVLPHELKRDIEEIHLG